MYVCARVPPEIPSEGGVALTLPAALQGRLAAARKHGLLATGAISLIGFASNEARLSENDRLAIVGDSIAGQKLHSEYMGTYAVLCTVRHDVRVFHSGWCAGRASRLTPSPSLSLSPAGVVSSAGFADVHLPMYVKA